MTSINQSKKFNCAARFALGLSVLGSSCVVDSTVDLGRPFRAGYGYLVLNNNQDSVAGSLVGSKMNYARGLTIDRKGRYLLAMADSNASGGEEAVWLRVLPTGAVDTSFGGGLGYFAPNLNQTALADGAAIGAKVERAFYTMGIGSDHAIYATFLSGAAGAAATGLIKASDDGVWDSTFSGSGVAWVSAPGTAIAGGTTQGLLFKMNSARTRMVGIGASDSSAVGLHAVGARFLLDGTLDTTFGSALGGTEEFNPAGAGIAGSPLATRNEDVVSVSEVQSDGSIFAAVRLTDFDGAVNGGTSPALIKVNSSGVFDPTFGPYGNGTAEIPGKGTTGIRGATFAGKDDQVTPINTPTVDSSGRIYLGLYSLDGGGVQDAIILRWTSAGMLDTSWGTGGVFVFNQGNIAVSGFGALADKNENLNGVAVDRLGRVWATGSSGDNATGTGFVLVVRLTSSGQLDTSFGSGAGYTLLHPGDRPTESFAGASAAATNEACLSITIDAFRRLVLNCASTNSAGRLEPVIIRLTSEGEINS